MITVKKHFWLLPLLCTGLMVSCDEESTNDDSDDDTPNTEAVHTLSILELFEGTEVSYSVNADETFVTINTPDLPNHTSPYYETDNELFEPYNGNNVDYNENPNKLSAQNFEFTIPLYPELDENHESTTLGAMGVARNGIVFYNQYAGPMEQPLTSEINSFDQWLGHPDGQSRYHYHIEPTFLTDTFGSNAFLGLLADGFPVYGPVENGEDVTNDDLDEFHGHSGATTEFPDGIYHYHVTAEAPYINGNGFYGTPGRISN